MDQEGKRVPSAPCPTCGKKLDAATCMSSDAQPRPGDYTVCLYCANVLRFRDGMKLAVLSLEDAEDLARDREFARKIFKAQRLIAQFKHMRG